MIYKNKAIIFDLDGTLWNSTKQVVKAYNNTIKSFGLNFVITEDEINMQMGKTAEEISKALFPQLGNEDAKRLLTLCMNNESIELTKFGGELYPNLEKTLNKLSQDYKLIIVSNCQESYLEAFFTYHKKLKRFFTDYESHGRTNLPKGENIKLVMKRNNIEKAVYVGDTLGDFEASKLAKIPFVFASYGFGKIEGIKEKVSIIESFTLLPQITDSLFLQTEE